ncbi:MAG: hypothetical protein EP302_03780 [Bacteroidetes bacterium]|jgi:outer membrane protein OmpA-like peptidoglycan-associated protein|nr:MAG: hypothetical protein EP302_03780 [Bacteroidota bacterium]UCE69443.1 MAG: hypothetical protein JSW57_00550 [Flavobacteriaceae bacterium]
MNLNLNYITLTGSFLLALVLPQGLFGQRKSDLLDRIDSLQAEIRQLQTTVSETQAREKASLAKAESYEAQVAELKDANATLLKNLGSFADVSNKKSDALTQALASLNDKEQQLNGIVGALGSNDSTIIALLNDAKRTLGENARMKVAAGSLIISGGLTELMGSDTGTEVTEDGRTMLQRVAALINAYPDMAVTVDGLTMTGDMVLAARQATEVMNVLQSEFSVPESRMKARARDGNFSEGVDILLHPDYRRFYSFVKEEVKN